MAHYIRTNHSMKNTDDNTAVHFDSINKAKKESTRLQTSGNTVSTSSKRTHRLHYMTAKR